jgi:hypothetical protein
MDSDGQISLRLARRDTPAINSAGQASQQRQEEKEQEGKRGQSPLHRGLAFKFSHTIS